MFIQREQCIQELKKTGKKHPIFPEQKVLVLCILMIDNNFKSLYYIVSYRTNYIYMGITPRIRPPADSGRRRRSCYQDRRRAAGKTGGIL